MWLKNGNDEVLVSIGQVKPGDLVVVRAGGVIPLDGVVAEGEITVNQASLTGESVPVAKRPGGALYAGTVVEEGECVLEVKQASGQGRYDQIVDMIQRSEQMKSAAEAKASNLADKLVPYTFAGSLLDLLLTRNVTRALSVLMVDFSCALKLAMPLAVMSAMREAGREHITVKGGRFLEATAKADTIIFDKTGTLTHACPQVAQIIPFNGKNEAEMLRLAACLEEHFPHSMANAVVEAARRRGLRHEERHAKVEYLVAHGIASSVDGEQVRIGSAHFIFEDEKVRIPEGEQEKFDTLPPEFSQLYLAIDGVLSAVICISDPLREEAKDVFSALRRLGVKKTVMLTGDSPRTAAAIAAQLGVDDFRAGVLPADKAEYVARLRREGHTITCMPHVPADLAAHLAEYDLILLDVMMPQTDGYELCSAIRDDTDCPILFLTAKTMEEDVDYGFSVGADDYIKKPFSIVELRARVAAHLRREQREKHHCLSIQGIRFLLASREVAAGGVTLPFTRTEYEITLLLAKNRGQTFSREQIYEAVLGYDKTGDESAITEHIKNIRKKFAAVNMAPIQTVWGIGYRWNA